MEKNKANYSVYSILSLVASILSLGVFGFPSYSYGVEMVIQIYAIVFAVLSLFLPLYAKKQRMRQGQKGKVLEIIAIVIGGFTFYTLIFAFTELPIAIGYLGWVACGIIYACIKPDNTERPTLENNAIATAEKDCDIGLEKTEMSNVLINDSMNQTEDKQLASPKCEPSNEGIDETKEPIGRPISGLKGGIVEEGTPTSGLDTISTVQFCHKCGASLSKESLFCSKCGTKVWTGEKE